MLFLIAKNTTPILNAESVNPDTTSLRILESVTADVLLSTELFHRLAFVPRDANLTNSLERTTDAMTVWIWLKDAWDAITGWILMNQNSNAFPVFQEKSFLMTENVLDAEPINMSSMTDHAETALIHLLDADNAHSRNRTTLTGHAIPVLEPFQPSPDLQDQSSPVCARELSISKDMEMKPTAKTASN